MQYSPSSRDRFSKKAGEWPLSALGLLTFLCWLGLAEAKKKVETDVKFSHLNSSDRHERKTPIAE